MRVTLTDHEIETLRLLEHSLWRAETRFDRGYMDEVMAPESFEFGRSGRTYDRQAILDGTPGPIRVELPLREFTVRSVAPGVALVTYVSVVEYESVEVSNRSTLWVHDGSRWLMLFHQGTPVPQQS